MLATILAALMLTTTGPDDFTTGPLISDFGPNAEVEVEMLIPEGFVFRHSFDFAAEADAGELNRHLVSAARFLNMHARAGVSAENLNLAIVFMVRAFKMSPTPPPTAHAMKAQATPILP